MYFLVFFLGASIGSFVATVIVRDKENKSLFLPSTCSKCNKRLSVFNLIPVLSFIYQKGRCDECKTQIKPLMLIIEILSGIYCLFIYHFYGFSANFIKLMIFYTFAFPISYIDAHHFVVRTKLVISGSIVVLIFVGAFEFNNIYNVLLGGAGGFIFFYVVHFFFKDKLGMGDVRLVFLLGLFSGLEGIFWTIMIGSLLGIVYSLTWIAIKHHTLRMRIPYAPFLCSGTFIYLTLGKYLKMLLPTKFI